jgi:dTDP-4-dehydrorhamnose reductase
VRAVTAWALLGSFNWDSLVTQDTGHYEPGAFDVRGPTPRPTALAQLLRDISKHARGDEFAHGAGWWQRDERFIRTDPEGDAPRVPARRPRRGREVLILSSARSAPHSPECASGGASFRLCSRTELDIGSASSIARALLGAQPWAIINAAGYVDVDGAESERERCFRENTLGPALLASACSLRSLRSLLFRATWSSTERRARPTPKITRQTR